MTENKNQNIELSIEPALAENVTQLENIEPATHRIELIICFTIMDQLPTISPPQRAKMFFVRHPAACGGWTLDFGMMERGVVCAACCYDCPSGVD